MSTFESLDSGTETRILFPLSEPEPERTGHDLPLVCVVDNAAELTAYRVITPPGGNDAA